MGTIASLMVEIKANTQGLRKDIDKTTSTVAKLEKGISKQNSKFQKELKQSGAAVVKLEKQIKKKNKSATKGFLTTNKAVSSLKRNLVALLSVYAAFRIFEDLETTGRAFNESIADLSAITGATGKDLKFLSDAAKEFGKTTTLSATQAAAAFKLVASAKPDLLKNIPALKAVTKEVVTLAEASGTSLPEAAKAVGSALNQFGASADEAARFVNVLAAGSKLGASEVQDTALALKDSGVAAKLAGLSFEQTNAAIQVLAANGIKASQAGNQLKNVLLNLTT